MCSSKPCQYVLFIVAMLSVAGCMPRTLVGKVVSLNDSTALPAFYVDAVNVYHKPLKTDGNGVFIVTTSKGKVHMEGWGYRGFNTVLKSRSVADTLRFYALRSADSTAALYEWRTGRPRLFCLHRGGSVGNLPTDNEFERTYGIAYFAVGDVIPGSREELATYNRHIATELDKKFGTSWRSKLRGDVVPFD